MNSPCYPITFAPILKERVWGGRRLEQYGKDLPPAVPIGESWEVTDRPEGTSVIRGGPWAGKDLRWLMEQHGQELLGTARPASEGRFPLLLKILDAKEKLSLQVHPPAELATALRGEPKTEMWYVAEAGQGAELYVGLQRGATRAEFERKIADGTVADCFHRVPVQRGDVMFLPSGRVHALGAELVIFEIQQNSDTTYRVFDWNRLGLDGKPRELHVEHSLRSIDFEDFEPGLVAAPFVERNGVKTRCLADNSLFRVVLWQTQTASTNLPMREPGRLQILAVVAGSLRVEHPVQSVTLAAGGFVLLPAALQDALVHGAAGTEFLLIEPTC